MVPAIDLNLVLVLHTVLTERNVARAAEKLHVTPSAVSNALARLRDTLGDPVVTRKGRGVVPTPRAEALAPGLARAMSEIEKAFLSVPFDPSTCTRAFTLAMADPGQITWGPRLAKAMQKEMPRAKLRVVGIDSLLSLGDLGSSEIDVHVGLPMDGPGMHAQPLLHEYSVLAVRKGHPLTRRKVARRDLEALRYVHVDMAPGKNLRDPYAASFSRLGVTRVIALSVPSYTTAAEIVASTDLATMMPGTLVGKRGLRALDTPLAPHRLSLAMCWHERTHNDAAGRAFRALVKAAVT